MNLNAESRLLARNQLAKDRRDVILAFLLIYLICIAFYLLVDYLAPKENLSYTILQAVILITISVAWTLFFNPFISVGLNITCLHFVYGRSISASSPFSLTGKIYKRAVGLNFLLTLFLFLWSLIVLVPMIILQFVFALVLMDPILSVVITVLVVVTCVALMIVVCIKALSYAMSPFILAENPKIRLVDAITISRQFMRGCKGQLFLIILIYSLYFLMVIIMPYLLLFAALSAILWQLLLASLLLVFAATIAGYLIFVPKAHVAIANFYVLRKKEIRATDAEFLPKEAAIYREIRDDSSAAMAPRPMDPDAEMKGADVPVTPETVELQRETQSANIETPPSTEDPYHKAQSANEGENLIATDLYAETSATSENEGQELSSAEEGAPEESTISDAEDQ